MGLVPCPTPPAHTFQFLTQGVLTSARGVPMAAMPTRRAAAASTAQNRAVPTARRAAWTSAVAGEWVAIEVGQPLNEVLCQSSCGREEEAGMHPALPTHTCASQHGWLCSGQSQRALCDLWSEMHTMQ